MEESIEKEDAVIASHRPLFAMGEARQSPQKVDSGDCFASLESDGSQRRAPVLSVIIVTHESAADIEACLKSVAREATPIGFEIIVVDAGSTDDTRAVVHQSCATAKYIQLRNVGFAAAANKGAATATGDILLFLNPDASLMSSALDLLVKRFEDQEGVGIIGGFLMNKSETPERWQAQPFPTLGNIVLNHWKRERNDDFNNDELATNENLMSCSWVSGGALCVRKKDFEMVGGFNESYFLYFEDVDLCRRTRDLGLGVFLDPKMMVLHQGGKSTNKERRVKAYDQSQSKYFLLHRPMWEYFGLQLLRFFFRHGIKFLLGGILAAVAVFGSSTNHWLSLVVIGVAVAVILATVRSPRVGLWLLAGSMVFGQTVRINMAGLSGTVTDLLLPVVLVGLFYAVVARGYLRELVQCMGRGWWLLAAVLPGILLAWQRLPLSDFTTTVSYAGRLFGLLLLIPLMRILRVSFLTTKKAIIIVGVFLAGLGFFQLLVLPSLPPKSDTVFSQLFLGLSGGGWDPHQFRLFSTWLDPNFMGMFFVMCLALLFVMMEKLMVNKKTEVIASHRPLVAMGEARQSPQKVDSGDCFASLESDGSALRLLASEWQAQRRRTLLLTYWFLELIIFVALTLTRSRAAFLALGAMLVVYFFVGHAKRFFVPIITAGVLTLLLFPSLSTRIFVSPLADPTVQLRLHSWQQALQHFSNYPWFGMGYNAYGIEQLAVGNVSQNINSLAGTDNFTLLLVVTTGIWGVTMLLFGMSRFVGRLIKGARNNNEGSLSVLLILVALFVNAQFIQSFTYIHLFLPLVLLLGANNSSVFRESPLEETP